MAATSVWLLVGFSSLAASAAQTDGPVECVVAGLAPSPRTENGRATAAAVFPSRIVELLASGRTGGQIDGGFTWAATPLGSASGSAWSVQMVVEVDGHGLLDGHDGDRIGVGIFGFIFAADGSLVGSVHQSCLLASRSSIETVAESGLRVVHQLELPPGPYSVRLAIEESTTKRHLLIVTDLNVPDRHPVQPVLLPVLVPAVDDSWVVLRTSGQGPEAGHVAFGERLFRPAAKAVVCRGLPTEVVLGGIGWTEDVQVAARFVDANGVVRARPVVRLGQRSRSEQAPLLATHSTIDPVNLPPGDYRLQLTMSSGRDGFSSTRSIQVVVVDRTEPVGWASLPDEIREEITPDPGELQAREIGSITAKTAALLLSGQRGGEVAGSLIWTVGRQTDLGGSSDFLFFVEAEGSTLLSGHTDPRLDVGVFAYVFSSDGTIAAHLAQGLSLDLRAYGEQLRAAGLKFAGRISLPTGSYAMRLLIRNQNTGRLFLSLTRFEVPNGAMEGTILLPPLFQDPQGTWVLTRQSGLDADAVGVDFVEPSFLPATRVVVGGTAETEVILGGAGWDRSSRLTARVADTQGRQLAEPVLTIGSEIEATAGPVRFFRATLGPLFVPPGVYTLEVMLDDEMTGSRRSQYIPLAVVPEDRQLKLWAALANIDEPEMISRQPIEPGTPAVSSEETAARYADALYLLAGEDRYRARDALVALEREVMASGSSRVASNLEKTERRIALELAKADPGVLLPIILLHRDAFRHYLVVREDLLADHSWRLAAALAEEAWKLEPTGGRSGFSETLLVALAADLVRTSMLSPAIDLLSRTVELAPSDPTALLALGATYERSGLYAQAIAPLKSLVQEHPDNAEGVLRLAVNLARDNHREEAAAHFQHLIANNSPTWITVIAYQELARLLPAKRATEALEEAVERYPGNQALRVQLAFQYDVGGRPAMAKNLVEEICRRAAAPETSPRVRYPGWPALGLGEKLLVYETEVDARLPALVVALDARVPDLNEKGAS